MILDQLKYWETYWFPPSCDPAFEFLSALTVESEEKEYSVQGDEIWARVMSYQTLEPKKTVLEAHRNYVDVQMLLGGQELVEIFNPERLDVVEGYDEERDVEFYQSREAPISRLLLQPGFFAMFFPQDAHRPQLRVQEEAEWVKKVVVKIRTDIL